MASGFFGGMIVGTVVSGLSIGVVSLLAELPGMRQPEAVALEAPVGSEFNPPRVDTGVELPGTETQPDAGNSLQANAPAPDDLRDDLRAVNSETRQSAAQPETGNSAGGLSLPVDIEESTGFEVISSDDAPVLQRQAVTVLEAPETENMLSIVTQTAALPALEASQIVAAGTPEPSVEPSVNISSTTAPVLAELLKLPKGPAAEDWEQSLSQESLTSKIAPAQPMLQQTSAASPAPQPDEGWVRELQIEAVTPSPPTVPVSKISPDVAPDVAINDSAASDGLVTQEQAAQETDEPDAKEALPESGPKSGGFENLAPGVTTNRLPSVTDTPVVEEETLQPDLPEETQAESKPQLERFAAEFENPDAKPLMAIVLIDDGTSKIDLEELKVFPYPLSFAIDTKWPDAPKAMRKYRDAGFEVLAMADLPKRAGAADTEVTMAIYLRAVPEAVAVMEGEGEGLQAGRKASMQLAQILAASGLGAVMLPKGLNTAQKLIAREGVPAITVFRDFDAKGESASMIQRYLDRAALKAGQEENGVIMVGRLRDETVSALVIWALEDRAARVALAPVSAVLRGM